MVSRLVESSSADNRVAERTSTCSATATVATHGPRGFSECSENASCDCDTATERTVASPTTPTAGKKGRSVGAPVHLWGAAGHPMSKADLMSEQPRRRRPPPVHSQGQDHWPAVRPSRDPRRQWPLLIDQVWAASCWLVITGDHVCAVPRVDGECLTPELFASVGAHQVELLHALTQTPAGTAA